MNVQRNKQCSALNSAAPHSLAGRCPVCIQSCFVDLMNRVNLMNRVRAASWELKTHTVDVQRDEQRSAAEPSRPPPRLHPVPLHGLYELQAGGGHLLRLVANVQPPGKAVDVQRRVDWPAHMRFVRVHSTSSPQATCSVSSWSKLMTPWAYLLRLLAPACR